MVARSLSLPASFSKKEKKTLTTALPRTLFFLNSTPSRPPPKKKTPNDKTTVQLAAEDHRWWWRSLACGASTGLFVAGYALYFFFAQSDMAGLMQGSFFFGYTGVCCWALSLMLGFVGWRSSLSFVRGMYRAIKSE